MATWTAQNAIQPSVNIDFQSANANPMIPGTRGVGALALPLNWGPQGQLITVQNSQDTTPLLGYPLSDPSMDPIVEFFKGSSTTAPPLTLLVWRLATTGGVKAAATASGLTATGLYVGPRTDLSFMVANDPNNSGKFVVTTYALGVVVDTVSNLSTIGTLIAADTANPVIAWTGTSGTALQVTPLTALTGGSNGIVTAGAFAAFLAALDTYNFDTVGYPGTELYGPSAVTSITSATTTATVTTTAPHGLSTGAIVTIAGATPAAYNGKYTITVTGASTFTYTFAGGTSPATGSITFDPTAYIVGQNQAVFIAQVKEWVNVEGKYVVGVLGAILDGSGNDTTATGADSEYIISVNNGVLLSSGTALSAAQCVAWVTGTSAGANYNQALTYSTYPGAVDCNPRLTNAQINTALTQGSFCFQPAGTNLVRVVQDIDTFTQYSPTKGSVFSSNRLMRTHCQIGNDVTNIYAASVIGKANNDADGRAVLTTMLYQYLLGMQSNHAIQNVQQSDITIAQGSASNSVLITLAIQDVNAIEKIYITVNVSN